MSKLTFAKGVVSKAGIKIATITKRGDVVEVLMVGNPVPYLFANMKGAKAFVTLRAVAL